MGFLEKIFRIDDYDLEKEIMIAEEDVVNDMLKDSKFTLTSLITAISESNNPQVRQMLKQEFNNALQKHFRLADLAIEKEWYHPYMTPQQQFKQDYEAVQDEIQE